MSIVFRVPELPLQRRKASCLISLHEAKRYACETLCCHQCLFLGPHDYRMKSSINIEAVALWTREFSISIPPFYRPFTLVFNFFPILKKMAGSFLTLPCVLKTQCLFLQNSKFLIKFPHERNTPDLQILR